MLSGCGDSGDGKRRVERELKAPMPDTGELKKGDEPEEEWPAVDLFRKRMLLESNDPDLLRRISPCIESRLKRCVDSFLQWEVRRQLNQQKENSAREDLKPYLVSLQRLSSPGVRPMRLEVATESQNPDLPLLDPLTVEIDEHRETREKTDFTPVLSAVLELVSGDMLRGGLEADQAGHFYKIFKEFPRDSWESRSIKRAIEGQSRTPLVNQYLELYLETLPEDQVYASVLKYRVPDYLRPRLQRIVAMMAKGGMMRNNPAGLFLQTVFDRVIIKLEDTEFFKVIHGHFSPGTVEGRLIMGNETTGESQVVSQVGKQKLPGAVSNTSLEPQEEAFRVTERIILEKMVREWVLQCFENSLSDETVHLVPLLLDMCDGPLMDQKERERIARLLRRVMELEKGNSYLILGLNAIGTNREHKIFEVYERIGTEAVSLWMDMYRQWPGSRGDALGRIILMKRNGSLESWPGIKPFIAEIAAGVVEMVGSLRQNPGVKIGYRDSEWMRRALLFLYLHEYQGDKEFVEAIRFLEGIAYEILDSEIKRFYQRVMAGSV